MFQVGDEVWTDEFGEFDEGYILEIQEDGVLVRFLDDDYEDWFRSDRVHLVSSDDWDGGE